MYPMEPTYTEHINQLIKEGKPVKEAIIKEYIDKHNTTQADIGEDYYYKRNDITKRVIYKYDNDGKKVIDTDATNNKLASGRHKLLVDQKVGYLVGDPITIGYRDDTDITEVLDLLGDDLNDYLTELVKNASNRGNDWLHPYIDEKGNFDYIVIPTQEIIPIYDNSKRKNLLAVIRYYKLDHDDIVKVEYWDEREVTYYEIVDGKLVLDATEEVNPASHFTYYKGNQSEGYGWEKVPFVEFKNNEDNIPDIHFYKDTIDVYDRIMSDSSNTIEDIQEFIYLLKGYSGEDIDNAITNLKRYKGVAVDEEGGLDIVQGEMPINSIDSFLDRLRETLYEEGQGVDTNTDKFGNSPSGIALKFLFSLLDMKASTMERKFIKALKQFMWFVCEYARMSGVGDYDSSKFKFTFNKSMLMNDAEQVTMAQQSKGIISDETIAENHPWVSDVEREKERMANEQPSFDLDDEVDNDGEEDE
ncbi:MULTISPECIES: phage portal protein [unclassified Oceanobacillus]|uniref:phage portal protein n=1 Tax=unclassified Oceanobacillus TaxID=2630292 RepID=UPI001BEAB1AA|nr:MULTISPECIES: phage portal protein [unclassified Oceanobacillus]MBT2601410.1 phage portal protein [Oceanobacillus sp. ISL-74]MBT2653313.1 phage portal protein [Oceanobacillus sp. ISL-73]